MPADGPPWPRQALIHQRCLAFPSGKLHPDGGSDECRWAPVPHFLLNSHLSSTIGGTSKKTKCPWLPPALVWTHTVGAGQPLTHIYPMEELPDFFLGGLVSHKLDGRCICPGVQPWEIMPVTMANQPFCLPSA